MADMANRSAGLLSESGSLLVIVDVQTKLLNAMPADEAQTMVQNTVKLLTAAGLLGLPVFLTEQYPKGLGASDGGILDHLPEGARRFDKTAFSCCGSEGFNEALVACGRKQVVIAGQETHVCVLQTAIDLCHQGYDVHVVEDAVCSRQQSHKNNALQRLGLSNVSVTNHESVLFEWLRDAKHRDFKAISTLLR